MFGDIEFQKQNNDDDKEELKIVTFADGTDEEISKMLEAHYNGDIDISEYWTVGDTRKIHINAISADSNNSTSHVEQDMTFVILDFNHDDLVTLIGEKTKAAVTVQCRETLGNKGTAENVYPWGKISGGNETDNWSLNPMRTWMNTSFIQALPTTLQPLIKQVTKKNLSTHIGTDTIDTQDKAFWLSYPEVFGKTKTSYYLNNGSVSNYEGVRYQYCKNNTNRIKYINFDGKSTATETYWWLRSPSSSFNNQHGGYSYISVDVTGTVQASYIDYLYSQAPAFCL